ncbi:IS5 family transposase [Polaromonas sp. JS666]|uniref:IS5 family transposase n=1 Tax=Polaromonas sp. (strain JS666 / ATCC BAA-500) TaxID=296591 RepID=UPI000A3133CE|nr:IS5 family transposase [Polaromonas sp. JS666]
MATRKRVESWVVTDEFWRRVEPLIPVRERSADKEYLRKAGAGRPPKPARQVFEAVVYVLRTGCQWKALPKERFGSASAVHKRFLEWEAAGVFEAIWKAGLAEYDQMEGIAWRWQSIDGAMFKAPLAQEAVGRNPTDRGKKGGSKRHLLVDGRGVPLSLVVTGANEHDVTQLDAVLQTIMVKRKTPGARRSKHLCADAGYRGRRALEIIESHGYIPHVVDRGKEADAKRRDPTKKARRWVVEVCHSWFNRFRKLLVRYEKLKRSFVALNHIAAAIIALRKVPLKINIIYG